MYYLKVSKDTKGDQGRILGLFVVVPCLQIPVASVFLNSLDTKAGRPQYSVGSSVLVPDSRKYLQKGGKMGPSQDLLLLQMMVQQCLLTTSAKDCLISSGFLAVDSRRAALGPITLPRPEANSCHYVFILLTNF